jgi:hypothetical protein
VDEAHTVIVAGDAGVGGQDGVLAVWAEHFGRCRCLATIGHCSDLGQFVLHPKPSLEVCHTRLQRRLVPQHPST